MGDSTGDSKYSEMESEDPNNSQLDVVVLAVDLLLDQHCAMINFEKRLVAMPIPTGLQGEKEGLLQDVLALLTMSETLRKTLDRLYTMVSKLSLKMEAKQTRLSGADVKNQIAPSRDVSENSLDHYLEFNLKEEEEEVDGNDVTDRQDVAGEDFDSADIKMEVDASDYDDPDYSADLSKTLKDDKLSQSASADDLNFGTPSSTGKHKCHLCDYSTDRNRTF